MNDIDEKEKEYLYKIQILKNALIAEKQKNVDLENQVKSLRKNNTDLEKEIDHKDNEILKLTNDKQKLTSQIDFHRHKSFKKDGNFLDYNVDDSEIEKLSENVMKRSSVIGVEKEIYTNDNKDIISDDTNNLEINGISSNNNLTVYSNYTAINNSNVVNSNIFINNSNSHNSQQKAIESDKNSKHQSTNEFLLKSVEKTDKDKDKDKNPIVETTLSRFGSMFGKLFSKEDVKIKNSSNTVGKFQNESSISSPRSSNSAFKFKQNDDNNDEYNDNQLDKNQYLIEKKKDQQLITTYEMMIHQLNVENRNNKQLLAEANKNIIKIKEEFQMLVATQVDKIKQLEKDLKISREDLVQYTRSTQSIIDQNKTYEIKNINNDNLIKSLQSELSACKETITKFQILIQDKELVICSLQDNLKRHENENTVLAKKLAELKNAILEENIRTQIFTGKKKEIFTSPSFNLTFMKNDEGFLVVIYEEEDGSKYECISIDDIDNLKVLNDSDNTLEFTFMKNKKSVTWTFIMNENIHQVIRVYRDFRERNYKQKNNLYY